MEETPGSGEALSERIVGDINGAMSTLTLYIGLRLGLFAALADAGTASSEELARQTGLSERYLREWLEAMVAGGYLEHDVRSGRFTIPPAYAPVLLEAEDPLHTLPFVQFLPPVARALSDVIEAFRTGGGVPYETYGSEFVEAQGGQSRNLFLSDLADTWLASLPDVRDRLMAGGRALDVGCGTGWAAIALALGFPKATVDALDPDSASIRKARQNAESMGVSDRVTLHESTIEGGTLEGPYDLVTAMEVVHDLAYPVKALRAMRELAMPGGTVLIVDEAVGDTLEENRNFIGHLFYNFSVLHCLPQAMTVPDSAATGTVMSPSTLRRYAQEAGYSSVNVLPVENPMFRLYRLTP
ncbi:MAG: methyltransferase domain-containing protein [Thermoplasmata archaeon]